MCIHVQSITYMHPDKDVLFSNVSFTISKGQKVASSETTVRENLP